MSDTYDDLTREGRIFWHPQQRCLTVEGAAQTYIIGGQVGRLVYNSDTRDGYSMCANCGDVRHVLVQFPGVLYCESCTHDAMAAATALADVPTPPEGATSYWIYSRGRRVYAPLVPVEPSTPDARNVLYSALSKST